MQTHSRLVIALTIAALSLLGSPVGAADINVGVKIDVAPPPIVLAPPALVVVPGTPVHQAPSASFNLFVYGQRYYSFHNGAWFVAAGPRAPWAVISLEAVPIAVRGVPVSHYKIAPGQAKKMDGREGGWCPPGQAKKGRC